MGMCHRKIIRTLYLTSNHIFLISRQPVQIYISEGNFALNIIDFIFYSNHSLIKKLSKIGCSFNQT